MFKFIKQKKNNDLNCEGVSATLTVADHAKIVDKFFRIVNTTYDFQEFLEAYKKVLYHHMFVVTFWRDRGGDADIEDNLKEFTLGKEIYTNEFFDRCYNNGVLNQNKDLILSRSDELTCGNIKHLEELLTW